MDIGDIEWPLVTLMYPLHNFFKDASSGFAEFHEHLEKPQYRPTSLDVLETRQRELRKFKQRGFNKEHGLDGAKAYNHQLQINKKEALLAAGASGASGVSGASNEGENANSENATGENADANALLAVVPKKSTGGRTSNKVKMEEKRKAFEKLNPSQKTVLLELVCCKVFKDFLKEFVYGSMHVCGHEFCSQKYGCKFVGHDLYHSFQYVVMMASVNKECRKIIGDFIHEAQQSRLRLFRELLPKVVYDPNQRQLPRSIFPSFLPAGAPPAIGHNLPPAIANHNSNIAKQINDNASKEPPAYIPLFQAVFGLLWKFGMFETLFEDRLADFHCIPQLAGNSTLNPIFSRVLYEPTVPYSFEKFPAQNVVKWSHFGMLAAVGHQYCHNCGIGLKEKGILLWGNMGWWFCSPACIYETTIEGGKWLLSLIYLCACHVSAMMFLA